MCDLATLYLGVKVPSFRGIMRPGAYHLARFMAKGIHIEKLAMFQMLLPFLSDQDKVYINQLPTLLYCLMFPGFLAVLRQKKPLAMTYNPCRIWKSLLRLCPRAFDVITGSLHFCIVAIVDEDLENSLRANMAVKLIANSVPESCSDVYSELCLPIQ